MSIDEDLYSSVYSEEILHRLEDEFPQTEGITYLDHAGSTLYSRSQMSAVMQDLSRSLYTNPHTRQSTHSEDSVRGRVLQLLNADPEEFAVVFNSGATSGLKLIGECFPWETGSQFWIHAESHTSSVGIREYARAKGATITPWTDDDISGILAKTKTQSQAASTACNLVCFPGMSNFNGYKYDLSWIGKFQETPGNYVLLDSAALLSTSPADLHVIKPDFLVLSFYKLFGYPTGLGALIINRKSAKILRRDYFGGGTVDMHQVNRMEHKRRGRLEDWLEDGTSHFLGIQAVRHGLDTIHSLGGMKIISEHVFSLAQYTFNTLTRLKHFNGSPVVEFYSKTEYKACSRQGGIVNFNILDSTGQHVGYSAFRRMCDNENIVVRTGCFCNTGSCQIYLNITDSQMDNNYSQGHVCGDDKDVIRGKPTGSIRASFGYMSTRTEADKLIAVVRDFFVENCPPQQEATPLQKVTLSQEVTSQPVKLSAIYVYPVKSCRGMKVDRWRVTPTGLQFDRTWAIMEGSHVLTQKQEPLLAQITASIETSSEDITEAVTGNWIEADGCPLRLRLSSPGLPPLLIPIGEDFNLKSTSNSPNKQPPTVSGEICTGRICGERIEGLSCGAEAGDWLEDALGRPGLRLVLGRKRERKDRKINGREERNREETSFTLANDSQILLLNTSSIVSLQEKMEETARQLGEEDRSARAFTLETLTHRFRGNLVVSGAGEFQEETWSHLAIQTRGQEAEKGEGGQREKVAGDDCGGVTTARLSISGPCKRCTVIGVDQTSGETSKEPLRSLAAFKNRKFCFGVHTTVVSPGTGIIRVGDQIMPEQQ